MVNKNLQKNIAIIPARSGSKGLKDKNIMDLNGKPLMAYSIHAAVKSGLFSEVMVSTDSEIYAEIARQNGANVPFLRSENNSTDVAKSWDVVTEVLSQYKDKDVFFDTVCLLQPTSPLRTAEDIINAYAFYNNKSADAVTSVCEADHSPLWCMNLPEDNSLKAFRENRKQGVPRQLQKQFYRLNGAIYIRKIIYDKGRIVLKDTDEYAFIMDRRNSIDIDTIDDFEMAEFLMNKKNSDK